MRVPAKVALVCVLVATACSGGSTGGGAGTGGDAGGGRGADASAADGGRDADAVAGTDSAAAGTGAAGVGGAGGIGAGGLGGSGLPPCDNTWSACAPTYLGRAYPQCNGLSVLPCDSVSECATYSIVTTLFAFESQQTCFYDAAGNLTGREGFRTGAIAIPHCLDGRRQEAASCAAVDASAD